MSADWSEITGSTRRGYTGHEMLDNLNFTHMNGRVYDQVVGRFISPDPLTDGAGRTQGWNRYAYVANNPLSLTDPAGFNAGRYRANRGGSIELGWASRMGGHQQKIKVVKRMWPMASTTASTSSS